MKNVFLSILFLAGSFLAGKAQDTVPRRDGWIDWQLVQSFGLNDWNRHAFASDRLPRAVSLSELRGTFHVYIRRPVGFFGDMSIGVMPRPRNGYADPSAQATLTTGTPFHLKEITEDDGYRSASGHFKMTFGLFGNIRGGDHGSIMLYGGVGLMTVNAPTCEAILKEQNANMQYIARYHWFGQDENSAGTASLGFLTFRLRAVRPVSPTIDLLLGAEYTWHYRRADFTETYTNYFNRNIVKTYESEGNRLGMAGLSIGIAFR
jgi:hypothetical protein